jgi:uncharacterized protein YjaG (DUF416 family)
MDSAIISFNEPDLVASLERIASPLRPVFAATCAERLMPALERFAARTGRRENANSLRELLSKLWLDLEGVRKLDLETIDVLTEECTDLIPSEDDEEQWVKEQPAAEDAATALAYALRCRSSGEAQEAAWSARRAYEALDNFVINQERIDTTEKGAEEAVLRSAVIQAELMRQRRDITELGGLAGESPEAVATTFRERARREGLSLFGSSV